MIHDLQTIIINVITHIHWTHTMATYQTPRRKQGTRKPNYYTYEAFIWIGLQAHSQKDLMDTRRSKQWAVQLMETEKKNKVKNLPCPGRGSFTVTDGSMGWTCLEQCIVGSGDKELLKWERSNSASLWKRGAATKMTPSYALTYTFTREWGRKSQTTTSQKHEEN